MSMTRREATLILQNGSWWDCLPDDMSDADMNPLQDALDVALEALRPVSREQVWGGMWIYDPDTGYAYCEMCKHTICQTDYLNGKLPPFCEMCGAPMTDEAVQMVMERMEALKDEA